MIQVRFFASVRESLATDATAVSADNIVTVADLINRLCLDNGDAWRSVLCQENLLVALNQVMVGADARLAAGDEVAFFPPVTGG